MEIHEVKFVVGGRWVILRELAIGILINVVVLGFARFAYGVILPFMQEGLGLTYTQAGLLGTVTALGYVGMVMFAGMAASKWGNKAAFCLGTLLASISLLSLGWSHRFSVVLFWMLLAGIGTSFAYTPLISYFMERYPRIRATVAGVVSGGWGLGMLLISFLVPWLMVVYPETGWRFAWIICGLIGLLTFGLALWLPSMVNQSPSPAVHQHHPETKSSMLGHVYLNSTVVGYGLIYFSMGLSYLIAPTFLLAYMIHAGISAKLAGVWMALNGFFGMFSGPMLGVLADRFGAMVMLRLAMIFKVMALALPTFWEHSAAFFFSSLLLGLTGGGMNSLLLANVSQHVSKQYISAALGYVTLFFGIGQLLGPSAAGWIIDTWSSGFRGAFWFAAVVLTVGYFMTYAMKTHRVKVASPVSKNDGC